MGGKKICVIGNGLAGACVSYHLIKAGAKVTVYDNRFNHSSFIAAGLITPLVFRRMNKSWRVDDFIDYLVPFYRSFEFSDQEVLRNIPLRRMFASEQERGYWLERQDNPEYSAYKFSINSKDENYHHAINNFGSGRVRNCYAVNTEPFFSKINAFIRERGTINEESFAYKELVDNKYKGETFDAFVFCEGYMNYLNPFFKDIPVGRTKGEILTIKAKSIPDGHSLNRKCFMLPLGDQKFKIGSTYSWNDPNPEPSEVGKQEIIEKFAYLSDEKIEVLSHVAGIRPTTMDRRPIVGKHPKNGHLYIFNGLGTKGYMSAPLLAKEFVEHLLDGTSLHEDVLIERYLVK